MARQNLVGQGLLIIEAHDHTQTHHTWWDSSGRVISPSQRPLPDNTQHSQQTNIHALCEIRAHNPSKRAAVDPRLRNYTLQYISVICHHEILLQIGFSVSLPLTSTHFLLNFTKIRLVSCNSVRL
jgi:hypothetical protein